MEVTHELPADAEQFGQVLDAYRRDLVVLCYRFLGSLTDAEDAAQETALRAWRGRGSYRGESGLRTWLHRIATRVCLDAIDRRGRRVMPEQLGGPAEAGSPPAPPTNEIRWLEPLPDWYLADASLDPAALYSLRESVSLAFTAALQALPARQRAVLLLRDVLAWRASEVAEVLDMTEPAVTSALNRARSSLKGRAEADKAAKVDRRLLERYMRAWETDDMDALVGILREEVRLAMPPSPAWYEGRDAVVELLRRWVMPMGPFRMRLTGANLQPAAVLLGVGPDGAEQPLGVHVLVIEGERVDVINAFMDPRIARGFVASPSTEPEMTTNDALAFVRLTRSIGVHIWIDGGWAVDACLGEQTRRHADLDIVVERRDVETLVEAMHVLGYRDVPRDDTRSWNFVLGDDAGHEIDFHVIAIDDLGRGVYGPAENEDYWPAQALNWSGGVIGGQGVPCTSPEWLIASHTGYELGSKDIADVAALRAKFGMGAARMIAPAKRSDGARRGKGEDNGRGTPGMA
jgi:RNA polymerase sigma-70 factor (ECF subfamily)